jgi:hypothetical protein
LFYLVDENKMKHVLIVALSAVALCSLFVSFHFNFGASVSFTPAATIILGSLDGDKKQQDQETTTDLRNNLAAEDDASQPDTEGTDVSTRGELQTRWEQGVQDLQKIFNINDSEKLRCIQQYRKEHVQTQDKSSIVHDRLAAVIEDLAVSSSCSTSRRFSLLSTPHFIGGRMQFLEYFSQRHWRPTFNRTDNSVVYLTSCITAFPSAYLNKKSPAIVSMSPFELKNALKIPFYNAVKTLFSSYQCDYRMFHPESFLVDSSDKCQELLNILQSEVPSKSSVWFVKSR